MRVFAEKKPAAHPRTSQPSAQQPQSASPHSLTPAFNQDFSHVPTHNAGQGYLSDEGVSPLEMQQDTIGIGQDAGRDAGAATAVDAGAAPDAGVAPAVAPDAGAAPDAGVAPAAALPAITSRATASAPDGTPDTRTTIGVCETIEFTVGGQVVDWSADNGWPRARTGQATFLWAAPERPGTSRITATDPATGQTSTLDMDVIAPNDIQMRRNSVLPYAAGTAGAGMLLEVRVQPRNVNFGWVSLLEDPGPATGVTGYFSAFGAAALRHVPNAAFVRFSFNNTIRFDTAATVAGTLPAPWSAGTFVWRIPNRYRCSYSTGAGHIFTHTRQAFSINAAGRVTVTKEGESVSRSP